MVILFGQKNAEASIRERSVEWDVVIAVVAACSRNPPLKDKAAWQPCGTDGSKDSTIAGSNLLPNTGLANQLQQAAVM